MFFAKGMRVAVASTMVCSVFLFSAIFSPARAEANPMLHAVNGEVIDAKGEAVLPRCVNLSPWLNPEPYLIGRSMRAMLRSPSEMKQNLVKLVGSEKAASFWRQWEETFVTESDFKHLAEQGFNCVRLPINARNIVDHQDNGKVTLKESSLAPVDRAVAWGEKYGIYVMIDLHTALGGQNPLSTVSDVPSDDKTAYLWKGANAVDNQHATVAIWKSLVSRYAKSTSVGGYDLLNEPALPSGVPKDTLMTFYQSIIAAIRQIDSYHMIIIEGDTYARDFSALQPSPDVNLMYQFHEYAIFNPDWKSPNQKALQSLLQLRTTTHMPLWLGEFGENSADWQKQMVQLMKANQIGWAIWPWKRIDLGNSHPVIETITMPDSWNKLSKYIDGALFASKPSPDEARQAMADMLVAIRSQNCREDAVLAAILAGK